MKRVFLYLFTLLIFLKISSYAHAETLPKLTIPSERISSVASSDFGLIAGEYDPRLWNNPFNGIFISYDKGQNWIKSGLQGRGVTDIKYENQQVYAATYYMADNQNGLFKTSPNGLNFTHTGPNYSASKVSVVESNIYLGTYSHGLWISKDNGLTWTQNTSLEGSYSTILELKTEKNLVVVSTNNKTYISYDSGINFDEKLILSGKKINNILISNNIILASSSNNNGIYRSTDFGHNFVKVEDWGNSISGAFINFNNKIYTSKLHTIDNRYYFYESNDDGLTWMDNQILLAQNIIDISMIFSLPTTLYLVCNSSGVYEYPIPQNQIEYFPYFSLPLNSLSANTFLNKISSYFDHEYPLLGYNFYQEPIYSAGTTYNFYGNKKNTNTLFYSSHNGIDFLANYGDSVSAVASGYAKYYYCTECGNSIKIDHQNGYQTTYMHLQLADLITSSNPLWVNKGQIIGRVGLTGKTTGPHLHFQVQIDKNNNGVFDDFPDGNVDPFGWLNEYLLDPWEYFKWSDTLGNHNGSKSKYLWEIPPSYTNKYIQPGDDEMNLNSKTLNFNLADLQNNKFTAILADFVSPYIPLEQVELKYVEGTSFSINLFNHLEESVINLDNDLTITIDLSNLNLEKFSINTLKLYFYDELEQIWKPLPTIMDFANKVLSVQTKHLSYFVVLGEPLYTKLPQSTLIIIGNLQGSYYTLYPQINIDVQDTNFVGISHILYSLDDGNNWSEYISPFVLEKDGIVDFLYRSIDNENNVEETKNQVIKINTKGYWTKQMKIKGSNFTT